MDNYNIDIARRKIYELELKRANIIVGSGSSPNAVWGTIIGDITQQKDLHKELTTVKDSIPEPYNDTQVKEDIASLKSTKANKSDISDLATKAELSSSLLGKADKEDTYTKQEVDNKIADSGSVDLTDYWEEITD